METYKVRFLGGRLDGGEAEYGSKVGGYIRVRHNDGVVEKYTRTTDSDIVSIYSIDLEGV